MRVDFESSKGALITGQAEARSASHVLVRWTTVKEELSRRAWVAASQVRALHGSLAKLPERSSDCPRQEWPREEWSPCGPRPARIACAACGSMQDPIVRMTTRPLTADERAVWESMDRLQLVLGDPTHLTDDLQWLRRCFYRDGVASLYSHNVAGVPPHVAVVSQ